MRSSVWSQQGMRRELLLGNGDRARDARAAPHEVQDVLWLLDGVRRSTEHPGLPRLSRPARRAARAQWRGDSARRARRIGTRLHRASPKHLRAEELFLSRPAEGLSDLAARSTA